MAVSTTTTTTVEAAIELQQINREQVKALSEPINEPINEPILVATAHGRHGMSRTHAAFIVTTLTGVNFLNTMGSGVLTVALPRMVHDVHLDESLLLWPASVYALVAGCTLLIFGSVGDVVGPKKVWLTGAFLYAIFTMAIGLCRSAGQLIAFRALLGFSISMCLPTAVSLTTNSFLPGRWRNLAFACQGMGQPLGYSVGLILGGVFTDTIGWRWSFYISAITNAVLFVCAFRVLPSTSATENQDILRSLQNDIDWIGASIMSVSLGLLSYEFAVISRDHEDLKKAYNLFLFIFAIALIPAFVFWVQRQERLRRPALIPNSLWKNAAFTTTCVAVFFTWAVFNSFQYFSALYFEQVEGVTALQASLRFLPMIFVGAMTNIVTGFLVETIDVRHLVSFSAAITVASSLLMALVTPEWGYWKGPFIAMLLSPLHPDVLFTVSNLIISRAYPGKSQSLAGAVFNVASQIANSVGLAVTAAISSSVAQKHGGGTAAVLEGFHAAFWTMFASMVLVVPITFFGLKKGGKVGAIE